MDNGRAGMRDHWEICATGVEACCQGLCLAGLFNAIFGDPRDASAAADAPLEERGRTTE